MSIQAPDSMMGEYLTSRVRQFRKLLAARGIETRVVGGQVPATVYVALRERSLREAVANAHERVVATRGKTGFEIIVLYPEDLQRDAGRRLFPPTPA